MPEQLDMPIFEAGEASLILEVLQRADLVFIKKLSRNDRAWAFDRHTTHQNGVYIPVEERDSGFFPRLEPKKRKDPNAAPILTTTFRTWWPQFNAWGTAKGGQSNLTNWRSKGEETHLTCLPKAAFADLSPASYLLIGRRSDGGSQLYECLTVDSSSEDALLLMELLGFDAEFSVGLKSLEREESKTRETVLEFADLLLQAWFGGTVGQFAEEHGTLPPTHVLAGMAQRQFFDEAGVADLNPYALERPGDAVRHISRKIEWDLFREYQLKSRAVSLIRIIAGDAPTDLTPTAILRSLIDKVQEIDALMLSASQQRKSRAGYSFEHHIERMLSDGQLPFAKQVIIEGKKRPDFVLPSLEWLYSPPEGMRNGLVLSAKTTLRERWKQVQREMDHGDMFLATVDESIAGNAIEDMATLGIHLVVPESLKASKDLDYRGHPNVLDFRTFFDEEVRNTRLKEWPRPASLLL